MKQCLCWIFLALLLFPGLCVAQDKRPSCVLLGEVDLKPLLGADHDAPVEFGEQSCRVETKAPGHRMVILTVMEQPSDELKKWLLAIKELTEKERTKEATVTAEPELGPEAFSISEKGERRDVEIYAIKGARALVVQSAWAIGGPVTDDDFKRLRQVARSVLDKLP
ncbi:MAG: hypothetical protein ABSF52_23920 [Syntrophobacteraceae bacterium]|jgi:hypothetical protein